MTRPFDPLRADHPMVGAPCSLCGEPMRVGERPTLVAIPGTGDGRIAEAAPAHWTCHSVTGHAELRRIANAARRLLEDHEWSAGSSGGQCPECWADAHPTREHVPGCDWAAALRDNATEPRS